MEKDIIILGAGLTGLAAGWKLAENNRNSIGIIEREDTVGGLAKNIYWGEHIFSIGPHPFYTDKEDILKIFSQLLNTDIKRILRKTKISINNKLFAYPLKLSELFSKMNFSSTIKCLSGYFKIKLSNNLPDTNFSNWIINRFGRHLYEMFFKPYNLKLWGRDPKYLSIDWAKERIAKMSLRELFISSLLKNYLPKDTQIVRDLLWLYYPAKGIGYLSERLAKSILKYKRNNLVLDSKVNKIIIEKSNRIKVIYIDKNNNEDSICANLIISTIPFMDLIKMIDPPVPDDIRKASTRLKFRSLICIFLKVDMEKILDVQYIYFSEFIFHRISEPIHYSLFMAPKKNSSLCLEVACDEGDEIWNYDDEKIYKLCLNDLLKTNLIDETKITGYHIYRISHAYPVYTLGYEKIKDMIVAYFRNIPNLFLAGRTGTFTYLDMDHCIEKGIKIAKAINLL